MLLRFYGVVGGQEVRIGLRDSASGFMNFGFGMAGIISPVVFGYAIDLTGRWDVPFVGSLAVLLLGALHALRCRPGERFVDVRGGFHADPENGLIRQRTPADGCTSQFGKRRMS